jgi:D-inositol-3-phosphate glycosyltransferase
LVDDHEPAHWAKVIGDLHADEAGRERLSRGAVAHAAGFSWDATVDALLDVYRGAQEEYDLVHGQD